MQWEPQSLIPISPLPAILRLALPWLLVATPSRNKIIATFNTIYHLGPSSRLKEQIPIQINILNAADIFQWQWCIIISHGTVTASGRKPPWFTVQSGKAIYIGRIKVRARRCNHTYFSKVMHHLLDALLVSKWCTTNTQHCCHMCAKSYSRCCITFVDSHSECCIIMAYTADSFGMYCQNRRFFSAVTGSHQSWYMQLFLTSLWRQRWRWFQFINSDIDQCYDKNDLPAGVGTRKTICYQWYHHSRVANLFEISNEISIP